MPKKVSSKPRVILSRRFELALYDRQKAGTRLYQIARAAGLSPATLSAITHGIVPITFGDARVCRIGHLLGLEPRQCFVRPRKKQDGAAA